MHLAAWSCSRVKFICHERGGVSGGLLSVLPDCRPVCGEPVRSGAGKHCYVKYECPAESHEDKQNASGKAQVA